MAHAPDGGDARASDDVCRWTCAYIVASKEFLRGSREVPRAQVAGVLREEEARAVEDAICFKIHRASGGSRRRIAASLRFGCASLMSGACFAAAAGSRGRGAGCNGAMARVVVDARERTLLQFFAERAEDYFTAQLPCGDVQAP